MNENIKFEYYIFIKKIKEKIYIKRKIKKFTNKKIYLQIDESIY